MYPTTEETTLWVALNLAQRSVYNAMDSALKSEGLPRLRWYDILWGIERSDADGLRPIEIERSLLFEQSNLSRILRRMIEEGLVKESVCPDDRRGRLLRITAKGRRVRKQMWKIYGPLIHMSMSKASKNHEPAQFTRALKSLIEQPELRSLIEQQE